MSRRLRYQVAMSLDGFIAGPRGEYDWIVSDPSIDFGAMFKQFDTLVMGRKTYEPVAAQGGHGAQPGVEVVVFSQTLPAATHAGVRIVNDDPREFVAALKKKPGRDIGLFGGGQLFRSLRSAGLVDTVEVAVMPVLIGEGIPLLPPGATTTLTLVDHPRSPWSDYARAPCLKPGGIVQLLFWAAVLAVATFLAVDTVRTIQHVGLTGDRPPLSVFHVALRLAISVSALGLLLFRRDPLERITLVIALAAAGSSTLFGLGMRSPGLFAFRLLSHVVVYVLAMLVSGRMMSRTISAKRLL